MTLTELIAAVRGILDEEVTEDLMWTDANITAWLNEANLRLSSELEDLEDTDYQDVFAATANYTLPTNFLRLDQAIYDGIYLKAIGREELKSYSAPGMPTTAQSGTSQRFYIRAGSIWLFPVPSASITNGLVLWYYKKPAALTAGVECEHDSQFHYLLPLYACYLGYQKDMCIRESQAMKAYYDEGCEKERQWMAIGEDRSELDQIYDPGD